MKIGTKVYGETNLIFSLFMGSGETNVQKLSPSTTTPTTDIPTWSAGRTAADKNRKMNR